MNPSLLPTYPISNDLVALQCLIQQLAQRLLDGDFSSYATPDDDRASYQVM